MRRAAVLIGVNRTGGLPVLRDAAKSAHRMAGWARSQGLAEQDIAVLTDDDESVSIGRITAAVRYFNELGTIDQLVVFFAGHGVNVARNERWLLSDAPEDANAAVNVTGSVELARFGGIPHVVLISDACRTAAQGIQAQSLTGSVIFPNEEIAELELPVDQFFSCRLGRPAFEIADPVATARRYKGVYTAALVDALSGKDRSALDGGGYVRPRPLREFLRVELSRRLHRLPNKAKLVQVPDAHIASDPDAWVSHIAGEGHSRGARLSEERRANEPGELAATERQLQRLPGVARLKRPNVTFDKMLDPALTGDLEGFDYVVREAQLSDESRLAEFASEVEARAGAFDQAYGEISCGFWVQGARVSSAFAVGGAADQVNDELVRVTAPDWHGTVVLALDGVAAVAVPAIPGFIATLTIEDRELVDVAYEPAQGTWRRPEFDRRSQEVRALRAVAASASREGAFQLEGESAFGMARAMQYAKSVDPTLAVYAAYAYADAGRRDLVHEMLGYMTSDLGGALFDVALLARDRFEHTGLRTHATFGFAPLLAQGWAFVSSRQSRFSPALKELEPHVLTGSLWTLYDETGLVLMQERLSSGDLR